ncbi:hypothetical protein BDQ17DRAFT_1435003 [Cyathus striatus]|nr:hypothetical protein BDQ17DRAFT_1435003 [Cyathus striatus]
MVYVTVISILFFSVAHAANDWSKPCLSGVCEYDLPSSTDGGSSGTVKIWGSQDSISDITTAAGWEILGCSADALSQDVRIVCKDDETSASECAHLFSNSGPEGKIVRLPQNCGKAAFARVARSYIPADQTIPPSISPRIVRRDGAQPQVKALSLDTSFAAVNSSKLGNVSFALKAATIPGVNGEIDIPQGLAIQSRAHHRFMQRGFLDFVGDAINSIKSLDDFSKSASTTLPIDATKSVEIFNQNISCPPLSAGAKVSVDIDAHGTANVGVAASGTIIPPKIDNFGITTSLTADLDGSVNVNANIGGSLDSGKIPIFNVGIPGLDFPGILTIGPSFEVNAEVTASLEIDADLTVGVNYHIANATFVFPPGSDSNTGGLSIPVILVSSHHVLFPKPICLNKIFTALQLSLSSSVKATGSVEAHVIPTLNLGISALGDTVKAGVFLDLDASAKASLTVDANAGVNATIDGAAPTGPTASANSKVVKPRGYTLPGHYYWNRPISRQDDVLISHPNAETDAALTDGASSASTSTTPTTSVLMSEIPSSQGTQDSTSTTTNSTTVSSFVSQSTSSSLVSSSQATSTSFTSSKGVTSTFTSSAVATSNTSGSSISTSGSASISGCFDVSAGLAVNVGADANFFGLFDPSTTLSLFNKDFELFQKCFGASTNSRRSLFSVARRSIERPRFAHQARDAYKRELTCLPSDVEGTGDLTSLVDDVVSAASAKEL